MDDTIASDRRVDLSGRARGGLVARVVVLGMFSPLVIGAVAGLGAAGGYGARAVGLRLPIGVWAGGGAAVGLTLCGLLVVGAARNGVWLEGDVVTFRWLRSRSVELTRAKSIILARYPGARRRQPNPFVCIVDAYGVPRWVWLRSGPLVAIPPTTVLELAQAIRRADCPGAPTTADALAALVADPSMASAIPKVRLPRSVTAQRWVWVPTLVVAVVGLATNLVPLLSPSKSSAPRALPAGVCAALLPAALLVRVVPAANAEPAPVVDNGTYTARARCTWRTDSAQMDTTAQARLTIRIERRSGTLRRDRGQEARDSFARDKRTQRNMRGTTVRYRVSDIARLGDSAYLAVPAFSNPPLREHSSSVEIHVLRADTVLTIEYTASPTDEPLAVSAAVAVARPALAAVR